MRRASSAEDSEWAKTSATKSMSFGTWIVTMKGICLPFKSGAGLAAPSSLPLPNLPSAVLAFWRKIPRMSMPARRRNAAICAAMQRLRAIMHICIRIAPASAPWIIGARHDSQATRAIREQAPMPHFTIEYSANLEPCVDMQAVVEAVRKAAVETGIFPLGGIRVRAIRCDHFAVADGRPHFGFLDMVLRLGEGRDLDGKSTGL